MTKPRPINFIVRVDCSPEYMLRIGNGEHPSQRGCEEHINALIAADQAKQAPHDGDLSPDDLAVELFGLKSAHGAPLPSVILPEVLRNEIVRLLGDASAKEFEAEPSTPWKCPKCTAPPNDHGRGGADLCKSRGSSSYCEGFLCGCNDVLLDGDFATEERTSITADDYGNTLDNPCRNATCHHCGWAGTFPVGAVNPDKLRGWAKTAWANGWRPPAGWIHDAR